MLTRIGDASRFSWAGLKTTFKDEAAFRQICFESFCLFPLAFFLSRTWLEFIFLIIPLFICLIVELLNSAIENCIDRISLERHPLSKKAKDQGSAAQMLAQAFLVLVWASYIFVLLLG